MTLIFRYGLILSFILCAVSAYAGSTSSSDREYQSARATYVALSKDSAKQQYRHHWDKVLSKLQRFTKRYPRHNKTPSAHYLLGKACRQLYNVSMVKNDARSAVQHFQHLSSNYSKNSLADDALYLQAEIEFTILNKPDAAYKHCKQIVQHYSTGDMANKARRLLKQLSAKQSPVKSSLQRSSLGGSAIPIKVTGVRHWSDDQHTRVVIELNHLTPFKVNTLAASQKDNSNARLYIDLFGAKRGKGLAAAQVVNRGVVKKIRVGENHKSSRIVCDLKYLTRYNVLELQDPPRIVIDIASSKGAVLKSNHPQIQSTPKVGQRDIASVLDQVTSDQPMRIHLPDIATKTKGKLRIVVDAGHGGKDPGAVGSKKLYEKDVVLKLAKKLASRLKRNLKCEVLLTRNRDVFIPLRQRTAYANEVDADLFISIHANASNNKKAHGIETYYLNFSKNDKAVAVAARENGMSIQEMGDLELILFDMMANAKINESSRLAAQIQTSLVKSLKRKYSNVKDLGVRQGPFHVLLGATMPSVLVEVAFISNKQEAKRLKSNTYLERVAEGIVVGVKRYLHSQNLLK